MAQPPAVSKALSHFPLKAFVLFIACLFSLTKLSVAQQEAWQKGNALFGELKYGDDFTHYDHVNPNAPKGGRLNRATIGGFDSLNPFVVRGRAAAGLNYGGGILWDTLFDQSVDQPSASYPLIAEAFRFPADYSSASYRLNPKARFHDGKQIAPEDVIWSLEVLKENQPLFNQYYHNVIRAEKTADHEVTFYFDQKGNRELPQIMGDMPVLPKHWWTGKDAKGNQRDISEPTTEIPLGSGPYKISEVKIGESITYERVTDYWAQELGSRKGRFNFGEIRYLYFADQSASWEAFKKGGIEDIWTENRSQRWAEEYNFPAYETGDVLRKEFATFGPEIYQAYYFNTRLEKFKDVRVREALQMLFDFETMNKNLFFGLYRRTDSFFVGGELQSSGLPQGRELEILETYRDQLDKRIFTEEFRLPVINSPRDTRKVQREAMRLFQEAGYRFSGGKLLDKAGKQFTIEFLGNSPADERIALPYIEKLRPLGIKANLRVVDTAQYKNRTDNYEFEITSNVTLQSLSPGNEQREYWSSAVVDKPGGRNWAGISDPVIDDLVEKIIAAPDREELIALTHALDRVLKYGFYTIPQWHNPNDWIAWWRKVQFPDLGESYVAVDSWSAWIDVEVEKEFGQ